MGEYFSVVRNTLLTIAALLGLALAWPGVRGVGPVPPLAPLLALVGIPLGVSSRKGGKSAAFVITVAIAFLYFMSLISLIGMARRETLSVPVAVWTPNAILLVVGLLLMIRLERTGDRDIIGSVR